MPAAEATSNNADSAPIYSSIIVPLDGSQRAEQILPHVEALARRFASTVILLQVTRSLEEVVAQTIPPAGLGMRAGSVPDPTSAAVLDPQPVLEAEQREAIQYLAGVAERLQERGLQVMYEFKQGPAAEAILERAEQTEAALIAMTTHGRSGLGRLVFGSVAEAVLRSSACPVFLLRVANAGEGGI